MRVSSGPHLITCWSFIKIRTIGQTDFTVCVYCEGVESDTTCSPVPVSDVTWQMTTLAADKICQHSHASWPWPRRLEWRLHLICCIKTSLSWRDQPTATIMIAVSWHRQPIASRVQDLPGCHADTHTQEGASPGEWGLSQLETGAMFCQSWHSRCYCSVVTGLLMTEKWSQKKLTAFIILGSPMIDSR